MLVVSPKSIVTVWQQELEKFTDFPYTAVVLDGDINRKSDTIRHHERQQPAGHHCQLRELLALEGDIARWKPDLIVCD